MVEFKDGHPAETEEIPDGNYYTQKEFAELLDIPEGTVRVWVSRKIVPSYSYYGRIFIPENTKFSYKRPWMRAVRCNAMQRRR